MSTRTRIASVLAGLLALTGISVIVADGKCREEPVPADPKDPPPREPGGGVPVTPPAPSTPPPVGAPAQEPQTPTPASTSPTSTAQPTLQRAL